MPKAPISNKEIKLIKSLRETGYSLVEIHRIVGRAKATVWKYMTGVKVLDQYAAILRAKQGGSRKRSADAWEASYVDARKLLPSIDFKQRLITLACLYWGEGAKKDFNLMNSDPEMIRVFIACLIDIGVPRDKLKIGIRIYQDINREEAIKYWTKVTGVTTNKILSVDVIYGKKTGKLRYGMCRVRITKGGKYFKLIMSMIDLLKSDIK